LRREVAAGRFRDDLFYRLCVIPISLPPLRERRGDIPLLADHVLRLQMAQMGQRNVLLSQEALDAMTNYDWPGNVRELQNAIHYALVKCGGNILKLGDFPPDLFHRAIAVPRRSKKGRKEKLNAASVRRMLEETGGNKMEAARRLYVTRPTLYRFLRLGRL
jgi:DNA-binding NtrC family response regulator